MKKHWTEKLEKIGACQEGVEWAFKQKSLAEAWKNCERGNWMLWLAGKVSGPSGDQRRRKLVLAACECAQLSLAYVKPGEKRPAEALKIATAWAMGEIVTLDELRVAADTAYAAYAAAATYAAYAADAADAADAATYAANAANAAANAANAADVATYAANAARNKTSKQCADIVRKYYPKAPKL